MPAGSPPLSLDSPGWRWLRAAHLHDGVCVTRVLGFCINSEVGVDLRDVPRLTQYVWAHVLSEVLLCLRLKRGSEGRCWPRGLSVPWPCFCGYGWMRGCVVRMPRSPWVLSSPECIPCVRGRTR